MDSRSDQTNSPRSGSAKEKDTWLSSSSPANASSKDQESSNLPGIEKTSRKDKRNISKYCHVFKDSRSNSISVTKQQYSGNQNSIVLLPTLLKTFVSSSEFVETKVSFLSLLKHKNEIGIMSRRKAERACKMNRTIIPLGPNLGCLASLFFPKTSDDNEDSSSCKITLLIKKTDEVNGESFFVGKESVTLNHMEYLELVQFVTDVVDDVEGGVSWRAIPDDNGSAIESGDDVFNQQKRKKFQMPDSSGDEGCSSLSKKYARKVGKNKSKKKTPMGKKIARQLSFPIYSSESE